MSQIDTSAAAIEAIRSAWKGKLASMDQAIQERWIAENEWPDSRIAVRTLLAALAEREELHKEQQAVAVKAIASRDADISSLRQQLSAREADLKCAQDAFVTKCAELYTAEQQLAAHDALRPKSDPDVEDIRADERDDLEAIENDSSLLWAKGWHGASQIYVLIRAYDRIRDEVVRAHRALEQTGQENESLRAAHDACLTQVREEMPEVEKARDDLPPIRKWFNKLEWDHVDALFKAVDTLQQNEARWRNARDVWQARETDLRATLAATEKANAAYYKQHKGMQRELASERDVWEAERKRLQDHVDWLVKDWDQADKTAVSANNEVYRLQQQLSASNAACAEMREAATKVLDWAKGRMPCPAGECCAELRDQIAALSSSIPAAECSDCDGKGFITRMGCEPYECGCKPSLAAQPKQQEKQYGCPVCKQSGCRCRE